MITNEIQFLFTVFLFLSTVLIGLLIYLMARKAFEISHRRKVREAKNQLNDKVLQYILSGGLQRTLHMDTKVKIEAIEELLSHYSEILEGIPEMNNLKELAQSQLSDFYRKNLRSIKWSTRMNTLFHIETFKMEALKEDILRLLNRKRLSKEEKIRGLRILTQFDPNSMFDLVTERHSDLSHLEYRSILSRIEGSGFDQFLLGYHSCGQELKFALLDLAGITKELKYVHFLESVYSVSSGEERVRSLKALAAIGHVRTLESFLPLFESVNWEERMLMARLAGKLKADKTLPTLIQLLQDKSWWVRSQAAQSIMMFPAGKNLLQDVVASSEDAFARDMAWEWINKGV